ncbi:hypothetical protein GOODEAATRI_020990 [Goodea atripinnis]|uniref:Uncharacterized protein n=1 Tax=Goodea atripinnis TaxID=208336 RepID=A0ABV0MUJ4_9TELE
MVKDGAELVGAPTWAVFAVAVIGTWTWEYRVCMGSASECTASIVVCLYIGWVCECFYVIVTECACFCVRLGLGLLPVILAPHQNVGPIFSLPVCWWFSVSGAGCVPGPQLASFFSFHFCLRVPCI